MTTTSSTSATSTIVTALGGGSGIDMTALATNLAAAQFAARTDRLATKSDTLDQQISTAGTLKSMLLSLSTSLGERVRAGDLSAQPSVASAGVASATLSGAGAPGGSIALEVTQLASAQVLVSPGIVPADAFVGSGTLTLRFGTIDGTFQEDPARAAVSIAIASGATLSDVASAVNAANAGVSAYVANTADGAKLVLKGREGAAQAFVLEATENPAEPGLAALAWEPVTGAPARLAAPAADAAFRLDGVDMASASNTVTDAIPGLNLVLVGRNIGTPTRITFSDLASAIASVMQDLVSALNEVAGELAGAIAPQTGDLARDPGARALRSALSGLAGSVVMPTAAAGSPSTLADLGLSTQRDGTFALDARRLSATLAADPKGAAAMFTNGLFGVFATVDKLVRGALAASDPGTLASSIGRYTAQKTHVAADQTKLAEQQEALRARLVARFAATDRQVSAAKATLSAIQAQIAAWNAQDS